MSNKYQLVQNIKESAAISKTERAIALADPQVDAARKALKAYQVERLKETHKEFLYSPNTQKAAQFFLSEIYGSNELHSRDSDIERLIPMMEKVFPVMALTIIDKALRLDALTEQLDAKMATVLGSNFTEEQYMKAYTEVSTKGEREEQLNLVRDVGIALCDLVRLPLISFTIKAMRVPASMANLDNIHNFLEKGFYTFKETRDAKGFVYKLVDNEKKILDDVFSQKSSEATLTDSVNRPKV